MAGRIYVVESSDTVSLVRAVSAAKALAHVVKNGYSTRVASAEDVATYMGMGATIENSEDLAQESEVAATGSAGGAEEDAG